MAGTTTETAGKLRGIATVGSILLGGALGGFLMLPEPQAHAALPVPVLVGAQPIQTQGDLGEAARLLAHHFLSQPLSVRAEGEEISASRAQFGVQVDLTHLRQLLQRAADPQSIMRRVHAAHRGEQVLQLPMPVQLDHGRALPLLVRLKDRVDTSAVDARIDPRKREVLPSRRGITLDLYATLERIDMALGSGEQAIEAAVDVVEPRHRAEAYAHVDMSADLATFQTAHSRGDRARNRTHNLRVAAAKIDGLVLEPGEVFDFNAVVGDRTRANGFEMAPVISSGQLVDGMGGGTCQVASTLHGAVFFAGLPVLTRHPHSRPSYYIKLGLDAAVAYGSLNFRFRNDRSFPIALGMTVEGGRVRASLRGAAQQRAVTFIRRVDAALPFPEKLVDDPELPRGLRVLSQRGVPGFEVTRMRVVQDVDGQHAVRERSSDIYPPTTQLWRVGTGGEAPEGYELPKNDSHIEYTADEYLKAVHTPGQKQLEVTAQAGRYGTYGWTEREGMLASGN